MQMIPKRIPVGTKDNIFVQVPLIQNVPSLCIL